MQCDLKAEPILELQVIGGVVSVPGVVPQREVYATEAVNLVVIKSAGREKE